MPELPQTREISARSPAQRAQCRRVRRAHSVLWLTPSAEPTNWESSRQTSEMCVPWSKSKTTAYRPRERRLRAAKPAPHPRRDHGNGNSLPTPCQTLLFLISPIFTQRAEGTSHLTQVVFALPNAARGALPCTKRCASDSPVGPLPRRRSARRGCPPFPSLARRHSQPPSEDEDAGAGRGDGS